MADLSRLPDDIVYVLRTGKLPPGVTLPDTDDEPEDPEHARFRARYRQLVDQRIAEWLADEQERDAGSLFDFGDRTVPADVRQQIEQDCGRRIQQEWRTYLERRDNPDDDDDGGGPVSWMQSVR
ncbi:hypothetical protein KC238_13375 [Mycobacteroides chelonae]|uniref:hypothetical protein n=1 Tax=Mycobacteroides chelonae TaxID=1774 RepID=UPI001C2C9C1F|nr:hypothetical protein [Mycobacteroides chelonae]MBV0918242.1 hypothetical protein [Mycobacteroides chelonae]UJW66067.1 hypothetical protein H0I67_01075 [Mycobacteroides chelonae]